MSVHTIYFKDGEKIKYLRPVINREEYIRLRNGGEQRAIVAAVRAGDERQKSRLVQMNYSCLPNEDGTLKGSTRITTTVGMDIDHVKLTDMQPIRERILAKKDELGLLMLELSARAQGYHLVFKRRPELSQEENLKWASGLLGVEYDKGAKDITRVFFTTTGSGGDLIYLDDAVFENTENISNTNLTNLTNKESTAQHSCDSSDSCSEKNLPSCSVPVDERVRFIAQGVMNEKGLEQSDFLDEGGRHTTVKVFLTGATQLLTKPEMNGVLSELMPEHWQDQNIQQLVSDFYQNYTNPNQRLLKYQEQLFAQSRRLYGSRQKDCLSPWREAVSPINGGTPVCNCELSRLFNSNRPPELPSQLPRLVKVVTQSTPKKYKATVAQAMFPPLGAYPKNLSFLYIDNQVRELRINCLIVAETGSGKDSCTRQPLAHIIADMKARDSVNRERLKRFNEEYNSKAGNKQKPQRPDDLVIQNIKSDITKAALVQRTDEANGAPLYVRINELEQWDKIEGCSGRSNQFTTLKLCDDEGNDFGSDRASTQSVTGDGCLHLNWNANTTVPKLMRYFRYVLTDGPISRLTLATVPDEEIGAEIPVFGDYGEAYDAELKPYIDNLKAATGVIDCPQAKRLAKRLKDECAEFASLSGDDVFDNLTHRALVMAFRKACLLYVANGMKWEKPIETFCRWSLFYDMYLKMRLFGDLIRQANDDVPTSKRGPRSLLEDLPDAFTLDDVKRVRQQQGLSNEGYQAIKMIRTWINRKRVIQNTEYSFQKAESFRKKNG